MLPYQSFLLYLLLLPLLPPHTHTEKAILPISIHKYLVDQIGKIAENTQL